MKSGLLVALMLFCLAATAQYVPTNGLIAYYPLNNNALDSSGNGYHMNISGATPMTDRYSRPNHAYRFDGINDLISYSTTLPVTNQYTWSFWVNVDTFQNCSLVYNGNTNTNGYGFCINSGTNSSVGSYGDHITFMSGGINYNMTLQFPQLFFYKWHHVVLTADNGSYKLYLNDSLVATCTAPFNPPVGQFHLGLDYTDSTNGFKGGLDDIAIYNRVLTLAEIDSIFRGCGNLVTTNPTNVTATPGDTVMFISQSYNVVSLKQWQADTGTGYFNLQNVAPFSGVYTDTLRINGVSASQTNNWNFRLWLTSNINCMDTSDNAQLIISPNSIAGIANNEVSSVIYPNPNSGAFFIDLNERIPIADITIADLSGRVVHTRKASRNKKESFDLNLPKGVYTISLFDLNNQRIAIHKLIIR